MSTPGTPMKQPWEEPLLEILASAGAAQGSNLTQGTQDGSGDFYTSVY